MKWTERSSLFLQYIHPKIKFTAVTDSQSTDIIRHVSGDPTCWVIIINAPAHKSVRHGFIHTLKQDQDVDSVLGWILPLTHHIM